MASQPLPLAVPETPDRPKLELVPPPAKKRDRAKFVYATADCAPCGKVTRHKVREASVFKPRDSRRGGHVVLSSITLKLECVKCRSKSQEKVMCLH